jgi:SAM-dependent methyltransferase
MSYEGKHVYEKDEADAYDASRSREYSWVREYSLIDRLCKEWPAGSTVLDIPSGTGRLIPLFQQRGHRVICGDISAHMMSQVSTANRAMPALRSLTQVDAEHLPFAENSVDYVISLRLFHFELPVVTAETMLREFARIARKGIVIHGPIEQWRLVPKVADAVVEIVYSGLFAPVQLAKKTKRTAELLKQRLTRGGKSPSNSHTPDGHPVFACTPAELESVLGPEGFHVTKSYGAISPISTKRIHMLEKIG